VRALVCKNVTDTPPPAGLVRKTKIWYNPR